MTLWMLEGDRRRAPFTEVLGEGREDSKGLNEEEEENLGQRCVVLYTNTDSVA